jgi:very-short-patch-repair endonuclease
VIEADGGQHANSPHDNIRDAYLRAEGFRVMRFWNNEILSNLEGVQAVIANCLAERCPHPGLPPQAREGDAP